MRKSKALWWAGEKVGGVGKLFLQQRAESLPQEGSMGLAPKDEKERSGHPGPEETKGSESLGNTVLSSLA